MEVVNYDELVNIRASSGIVKDYSRSTGVAQIIEPPQQYEILLDMIRNDPVMWTALDLTVDMCTFNGFDFAGKNDQLRDDAIKKFNSDLDFDQVLKNIMFQLLIYGDAFMEIVKKDGKVIELHPLETTQMAIDYDEHGTINKFVQRPLGRGVTSLDKTSWIDFSPEKIVYFRMYWIGSRVYSYSPLESTARGYNTKIFANHYLQQLFRNLHPKIIYFLKNANADQRESFIQNLRRAKTDPAIDIVGHGSGTSELTSNMLQFTFDSGLLDILEYLRTEVLMVTRVPKLWIGVTEGTNRSTAEAEIIPFETRVKRIQQIVASFVNKDLMPKLGYDNLKFKFNPISLMDEKSIFENAQVFHGLQIETEKENPVLTYLRSHGVQLPSDAKIKSPSEMPKDGFPSRFRENPQTDKMNTEIGKKGISEAGTEKLEATQANMKA